MVDQRAEAGVRTLQERVNNLEQELQEARQEAQRRDGYLKNYQTWLKEADERTTSVEEKRNEAERRANEAERRANEAEDRAADAEQRAERAEKAQREAEQRAKDAISQQCFAKFVLPHGELRCSSGSVVSFSGDAVVNATNRGCLSGDGVDGAITAAGGAEMAAARLALPQLRPGVRCETGQAVTTVGGGLAATWCIHAVGPNYWEVEDDAAEGGDSFEGEEALEAALRRGDELLASAYATAMRCAREKGAATVGFALLSAGLFRGRRSLRAVLDIAVRAVRDAAYPGLGRVHLVAFTPAEQRTLLDAAAALLGVAGGSEAPPAGGKDSPEQKKPAPDAGADADK